MITLEVERSDFRRTRLHRTEAGKLAAGGARLRPEILAMTANNVTYAAMGEGELRYFDFFPAEPGWGRPPAWGFAVVEESRAEGIAPGERYYGYFPLSDSLDVLPVKISPRGFVDGAAHRQGKAPVYNQYLQTASDPAYVARSEPEQALFRPLYATGWWAADFLWQTAAPPQSIILSSASAKTAIATAHQLRRLGAPCLIALTSARNRAYVGSLGLYDRVEIYDEADRLSAAAPSVFVDFLGRDSLIATVHRALGTALAKSVIIGATEWTAKPGGILVPEERLEGPQPEFFFVPAHAAARLKDAGPELARAMQQDMVAFYDSSAAYVTPNVLHGSAAMETCWQRLCAGSVNPREGLVVMPRA